MSGRFDVGPPKGEAELRAFVDVFVQALLSSPPGAGFHERWAARTGTHSYVARRRGVVVGGYALLPFGQFFGGRSVPMAGVSAVAVAPEHRGEGVAIALMRHAMAEARRQGRPISALYPATQTLYRKVGWESAGTRVLHRVSASAIDVRDRGLAVRRAGPGEHGLLRALYRERARATNGNLDRGDWSWWRVLEDPTIPVDAYLVGPTRRPEGYVVTHKRPATPVRYDVHVRDVAATSASAGRRLWSLLADHRSMAGGVLFHGGPADPWLLQLAEPDVRVESRWDWMLRIVDVRRALEARGWPAGLRARLELDVRDDLARSNAGRFTVDVSGGEARVRRGGAGRIRLDVRGLAPLYSGFLCAEEVARAGLLAGSPSDLADVSAAFGGPAPWMPEMF